MEKASNFVLGYYEPQLKLFRAISAACIALGTSCKHYSERQTRLFIENFYIYSQRVSSYFTLITPKHLMFRVIYYLMSYVSVKCYTQRRCTTQIMDRNVFHCWAELKIHFIFTSPVTMANLKISENVQVEQFPILNFENFSVRPSFELSRQHAFHFLTIKYDDISSSSCQRIR